MAAVRDTAAMIAGMDPVLRPGIWHFCLLPRGSEALGADALATMQEPEGMSAILSAEDAARHGFGTEMPMAHILLQVHSALDGVGLTAAVSAALAEGNIPCNIVAGFHHDHLFVPKDQADRAVAVLKARAAA